MMESIVAMSLLVVLLCQSVYCVVSDMESTSSSEEMDSNFTTVLPAILRPVNGTLIFEPQNYTLTTKDNSDESNDTESPVFKDDHSNEGGIDSRGCNTGLRDRLEDECFDEFQVSLTTSAQLEDDDVKVKEICCISEKYERCAMIGYEKADCKADHESIKEDLKAARIFLVTLNASCAIHRGKCGFDSAASQSSLSSLLLVFLGFLPAIFLL